MTGQPLDLDTLAALLSAATPGPWGEDELGFIWRDGDETAIGGAESDEDAALIAALRNAADDLLDAARHVDGYRITARAAMENERAARAEVVRLREAVEAVLASSERHNSLVETVQLRRRIRAALASPTPTPESTR